MLNVLETRERLYWLEQALLKTSSTVVQVSLALPGGYSIYPWESLYVEAKEAVIAHLTAIGAVVDAIVDIQTAIGPVCFLPTKSSGLDIKAQMIWLEETAPKGRLWDLDVITREGTVDRTALGCRPRKCLVCGEEAHICRRLGSHNRDEVVAAAKALLGR